VSRIQTVVVASLNPVKLRAVERGFQRAFPGQAFRLEAHEVPAGVGDQPHTDEETLRGAQNRALAASGAAPRADYWVGIEGGIHERPEGMASFAWVVVSSRDRTGRGRTGTFYLPEAVAALIRKGHELGDADDRVFGRSNSKQQEGAAGILTAGALDRADLYEQAVVLALIPFKNPGLYPAAASHW
jgi:inosine/xanthosine triphosphatase